MEVTEVKEMRKWILVLCTILLCFLTTCHFQRSPLDLAVCASYGVPGMMTLELKGGSFSCNILETDSDGRVLFTYQAISSFTDKEETALVICQSVEEDRIFFYEDECYLFGSWTDEDIRQLKNRNDWGLPMNHGKMTSRRKQISADLFLIPDVKLHHPEVISSCQKALGSRYAIKDVLFLDTDEMGHILYQINAILEDTNVIFLAIVNSDYETALLEWNPDALSLLPMFKRENGWNK